ncbi:MAG: SDR family NAD(P)-dependent oxidoreductase, partial [Proteobacteria bacterium]|nr:SDR family NAD(P)-dependent oxidoreductase [Pseudomonadota bacterium]
METSLQGRVAVVTGGSKGLGFATAKAYFSHGAKVALLARGADELAAAAVALRELTLAEEYQASASVATFV